MILLNVDNLKKVMDKENLNQSSLSKKMGLSRACVNRHITGSRRYPSAKFIGAIRKTFPEYSFEYFFTLSGAKGEQEATKAGSA